MDIGTATVLNMIPGGVMPIVSVNQYDAGYQKKFRLFNGATPFNIASNQSVTIRGTKGDGHGIVNSVQSTVGSNEVSVTITEQMTAVKGVRNIYELRVVDNNGMVIGTANFIMFVERAALDDDTIISDSDLSYANDVYNRLQSVDAYKAQLDAASADIIVLQDEKVQRFDTCQNMKASTALRVGMVCQTAGYYAVNDGGGALYRIYSAAPATHYETLANGLYAMLIAKGCVYVEQYGAYGDGTTDDTNAINLALASGMAVVFRKRYKITQALQLSTGSFLIGVNNTEIDTYVSDYALVGTNDILSYVTINGINFVNKNTPNPQKQPGNFTKNIQASKIENCNIDCYSEIFEIINQVSLIKNNRFHTIYYRFCKGAVDSIVCDNYINASRYGIENSVVVSDSIDTTVFTANFIDYFRTVFHMFNGTGATITNNRFDRCVAVFHDNVVEATISNNVFSNCYYNPANWTVLTEAQKTALSNTVWAVFKFDTEMSSLFSSQKASLIQTLFTNNVIRTCQYYLYIAPNINVTPVMDTYFRDNTAVDQRDWSSIPSSGKFTNLEGTFNFYKRTMVTVFFDFWDMKEYDTLPSPLWVSNTARSIEAFKGMRVIHNGDVYIDVDQTWKKIT